MKKMATNSLTQNTRAGAKGWLNDTKQYHYFLPAFNTQYPWKDQSHEKSELEQKEKKKNSMQSTVKYSFH